MKKIILLLYFFSLTALLSAQNKNVLWISKTDSSGTIVLDKFWTFHNGDDSAWALSSFDDSKWDTIDTELHFEKDGSNQFKGIAWFRIHIYIDSLLDDCPLAIMVDQKGASQLFVDGKLMHSFGTVSSNLKNEETFNPNETPLPFKYGKITGVHVLAVRYSNLNYLSFYKNYDDYKPGFTIGITKQDDDIMQLLDTKIINTSIEVSLGIFFITLGFVHFLIFLFYRKRKSNIYYSFFALFFALLFLFPVIISNTSHSEVSTKWEYYYFIVLLPLFSFSMLLLEYSLFRKSFGKNLFFTTLVILLIAIIISLLSKEHIIDHFLFSFVIGTITASFFIVIKSIIKKQDGAWIIGTGSILFLVFMGILILKLILTSQLSFNISLNTASGITIFILIVLTIMSIPISMSVFLAREFAQTNKNLENKLVEVEKLSLKTIDQEKERQKILETQKEVLEVQVKERTSEIVEQKTIIERKNKDITDSINYAKTIQEAILPSKEIKYNLFQNSFILFKPKDIVSGDFYWFAEKDGKKIIAACDCTGHGVPGALMSMIGNNLLSQIVNEKGITIPNEILNHLHKDIRHTLKQEEQNDTRDGMDAAFITFNTETEIEFAGAQRPLWIIRKIDTGELAINNTNNYQLIEIKGNKYAIGGLQSETERKFTNHKISLCKNDCIYIFSDGFADQFNDVDKKLMTSRFKDLLLSIQQKKMPEQELFLNDFIEKWKGNREQIDDILVIGIIV